MALPINRCIILTDNEALPFSAELAQYDGTQAGNGSGEPLPTPTPTPTPTPAPVFSSAPTIASDGTPQVGETLRATAGTSSNTTAHVLQWLRAGTAISGAIGAEYTPTQIGAYSVRDTASGPGGSTQATSAVLNVTAATPAPTPTPTPTPTSSLDNDVALFTGDNNTSRWIEGGNMSLPNGDWTIHIGVRIPETALNNGAMPLFSMGGNGDSVTNTDSCLNIAYFPPSTGMSREPYRGVLAAFGYSYDYDRLQTDQRSTTLYFGTGPTPWAVPMLVGPMDGSVGDNRNRSVFLCRRGTTIEFWVVDPGCVPYLHDSYNPGTAWKGIANKPFLLGAFNLNDKSFGNTAWRLHIQRFFKVDQALSPAQMVRVAQGADPRAVVSFNAATDRLISFNGTNETQTDLVSGQTVRLVGSGWSTSDSIIPASEVADMPRGRVYGYGQTIHRTGPSTSDVPLDGTVSGADGDIYARLVDWNNNGTVVADWQKVATSSGGSWSGKMTGVPSTGFRTMDVHLRKGAGGVIYALRRQVQVGVLVDFEGQSIAEFPVSSGNRWADDNSPAKNFLSFYSDAHTIGQKNKVLGWRRNDGSGWGASVFAQKLAEQLGCPVGVMCSAVEGSTAASWAKRTDSSVTSTPAWANLAKFRPGYIWWQQGQGSTGDSDAVHTADLNKIEEDRRAALPNNYRLIFSTLINCQNDDMAFTRAIQDRWVKARSATDSRVYQVAGLVDLELKDGVHQTDDLRGNGRLMERVADKIAYLEGSRSADPLGPVISSVTKVSDTVTRVGITHRGGADLRTPAAGKITGFEVSKVQNFSSTLSVSDARIINASTIELTHASLEGATPWVWYQRGRPGGDGSLTNGMMSAVANAVYDNLSPSVNTTLGYPLYYMTEALSPSGATPTPTPTPTPGNRAAVFGGKNGEVGAFYTNQSVAHAVGNNLLDAQIKIKMSTYVAANGAINLASNWDANDALNRSWRFSLGTDGGMNFEFADYDRSYQGAYSGVDVRTLNGGDLSAGIWLRVVANPTTTNNRSVTDLKVNGVDYSIPNNTVAFFWSTDGQNWTLAKSVIVNVNSGIHWRGDNAALSIGANDSNGNRNSPPVGSFYYVLIRDGDGKVISKINFTNRAAQSSGTFSDDNNVGTYNIYNDAEIK